jgi:hypothetical protein
MEFFSPAGARCDPKPGDLFSLVTVLSFPKWYKRYKIIREKIRIHGIFTLETACFYGAEGRYLLG